MPPTFTIVDGEQKNVNPFPELFFLTSLRVSFRLGFRPF
ncbi:hypothetical protein CWATWH0003_B031 [Crocosphaera watsonii WH 0003]|uniref:Uncharacterized protein n=1 Tax=Crocosphaera watsonii WH 0003 TaxID=423471 RepID=G5JE44_CROWT|nr:hypothetical protein CWATWH0003_B031 [Crocosphaera watsonii WH 0003]